MDVRRRSSLPNTRFGSQLYDRDAFLAGGRSHTDWQGGGVPNDWVPHSPFFDDVPANDNFEDEEMAA